MEVPKVVLATAIEKFGISVSVPVNINGDFDGATTSGAQFHTPAPARDWVPAN
jgi:hypothetical protein